MWDQAATKLPAGPHGLDPALVTRVQRERVLEALAAVVAEIGYQDATIRKVLDRARISRITFYELFDNKEQCFLAAYDDALRQVFARVERACDAEALAPPAQRLDAALDALLGFLAEEPDVARLCVVEVLAAGPAGRERRAATMDRFAAMMESFLAEARPDRDLGPIAARALVGGAEEVIFGALERGEADLPAVAAEIADTQLKLIA
ncbi:MAG TPA: TetR/AcrR family transcriptional regulator [Thermoleophilaceae bacterium]|nr:TetR/AcrR family transcriptional regulator [Thermoleophilaceae bacterium]